MAVIKSFIELKVYQLGREQAKKIFNITRLFPEEERYSLTNQIRRSRRRYEAAFINKIDKALGEAMETQAWLDHSFECGYINAKQHEELDKAWQYAGAMLNRMIVRADDFCKAFAVTKSK